MAKHDTPLHTDLILLCQDAVGSDIAQQGVRALFRYFGGQMIYIPRWKNDGESAANLRGVLADAVGDSPAQIMLDKIMFSYGGFQVYFPLESCAFRKIIALEIYERHYTHGVPMNDLARDYNISFNFAYKLWQEGRREKLHKTLPYQPFLDFIQ